MVSPINSPRTKNEKPETELERKRIEEAVSDLVQVRRVGNPEIEFSSRRISGLSVVFPSSPPMNLQFDSMLACSTPERENCDLDSELSKAIEERNRDLVLHSIVTTGTRVSGINDHFASVVAEKWEPEALLLAAKTDDFSNFNTVLSCIREGWYPVIAVLFIRNPHLYAELDFFIESLEEDGSKEISTFFNEAKEKKLDKKAEIEQYLSDRDWTRVLDYLDTPSNPIPDPNSYCALAIKKYQPEVAEKLAFHTVDFVDTQAVSMAQEKGYRNLLKILFRKNPDLREYCKSQQSLHECYNASFEWSKNVQASTLNDAFDRARQLFGASNDPDAATQVLTMGEIQNPLELIEAAEAVNWRQTLNALMGHS